MAGPRTTPCTNILPRAKAATTDFLIRKLASDKNPTVRLVRKRNGDDSKHTDSKTSFLPIPHHESLTVKEMFYSAEGQRSTKFAEEIDAMTQKARESGTNMCSVSIGGTRGVLLIEPEDIANILEKHKDDLDTKESIELFEHHFPNAVMAHPTGTKWRMLRNEIGDSVHALHKNPQAIVKIAMEHIERLRTEKKETFDLKELAHSYTLDVVLRGIVGAESVAPETKKMLAKLVEEGIDEAVKLANIAWLTVESYRPFNSSLFRVELESDKYVKKAEDIIKREVLNEPNNRAAILESGKQNYVTRKIENARLNRSWWYKRCFDAKFDINTLANDVVFLMMAGSDTSAAHFAFTFLLLLQNRYWLKRAMKEVEELGHPTTWTAEKFQKTPVLEAIDLESLRLLPPIRFRKVRVNRSFTQDGVEFKAGDQVFINVAEMHKSAKAYKDPNKFDPGRFIGLSHIDRKQFPMSPFGEGPHSCPGAPIAKREVIIALACFIAECGDLLDLEKKWDEKIVATFSSRPASDPHVRIAPRIHP